MFSPTLDDVDMLKRLQAALDGEPAAIFDGALARVASEGEKAVKELLPALPRKIGATPLGDGRHEVDVGEAQPARIHLGAWRLCDAAGAALIEAAGASDDLLVDLYLHGDLEERIIVNRAATLRPVTAGVVRLLDEAQRTNMESHYKAAVCDSNLPLRAAAHDAFGADGFRRAILKAAFLGIDVERLLEVERGADAELSRMLQDLATEREAAGRSVWAGTAWLIAHAPTDGSIARIIGGLEHGDDRLRLYAARGLAILGQDSLGAYARERLPREPRAEVRAALELALGTNA